MILCDAPGPLWCDADRDRLEQVLSNLIGNAIVHGADPIAVRVRDEQGTICVSVHNAGQPIAEELIPQMFEPFRHGTREGSLGLGLYIVDEIVRAHGGTMAVSSTASEGTTFTMRLARSFQGC